MTLNNKQHDLVTRGWPVDGLERVENCPVCGGIPRDQLYSGLTDRIFHCAPGAWNIYQCRGCRSAYLDPRPSLDSICLAYRNYYTHQGVQRSATAALSPLRKFARALVNGYRNRQYGGELLPEYKLGAHIIPLIPMLRQTLDRQLRYLPPVKPGARLLDVGFGSGEFMELARQVGWRVLGVDLDQLAVANALVAGLDVSQGDIKSFGDTSEQFDVITMSHVLEHVHNPSETVAQAYQLLKPGGLLYIDTPNIDAYGHQHFGAYWRGLEAPRHLVIFNWASLIGLLNSVGFTAARKIYKFAPYANLARASRISNGNMGSWALYFFYVIDFMNEFYLKCSPFSRRERTEFITLYASK